MSGKGVMTAGKWQEGRFLPFLALPLMIKVMSEKELLEQEKKSEEQEEHIAWMKWIKKI